LVVPASRNFNASRLDIRSAVLSISALSSFIYTIIEIPVHGIFDSRVMIAAALAVITGIVFVLRQRRISNPLIDVYLFKNRQFSSSVLPISVMSLGIGGVMFLMTQFLQVVLGYGPMEAGLRMFVPIMIGYAIGAGLSPKLEAMFGTRIVVLTGLLIVSVFFTGFVFSTPETSYYLIAAGIVGISLGIGMAMTPATSAVMGAVPGGHTGVGSAMNDATREIGTALGIAVMGSIANSIFGVGMSEVTATLPADVATVATDSVGGAIAVAESLGGVVGESLRTTGVQVFMDALGIAFAVAGLTSAAAAAVVFKFMPKKGETQDA
ncbi:MFS transporter, partial [Dehalococcoides mccartyi]|nr:MFS transporter [Dehalococcoides mccartyi]